MQVNSNWLETAMWRNHMFYLFLNGYSATTSQSSYLGREKKVKTKENHWFRLSTCSPRRCGEAVKREKRVLILTFSPFIKL